MNKIFSYYNEKVGDLHHIALGLFKKKIILHYYRIGIEKYIFIDILSKQFNLYSNLFAIKISKFFNKNRKKDICKKLNLNYKKSKRSINILK